MGPEPTFESGARRLGLILLLVLGLAATSFVTYRHFLVLKTLPKIKLSPQPLEAPLSLDDLSRPGFRWVQATVTPSVSSSKTARYRNTVESSGTLILQFKDGAAAADSPAISTPRSYRGILYTALNRSRPGAVSTPLIRDLNEIGISPGARFAVLLVDQSPLFLWKSVIKESIVLVSGMLIAILLLIHCRRAAIALRAGTRWDGPVHDRDQQRRAPSIGRASRVLALAIPLFAIAWAIYSSLRTRPVLPVGTIVGFGISAGLALVAAGYRHLVNRHSRAARICGL
jgi:hypothetical protein